MPGHLVVGDVGGDDGEPGFRVDRFHRQRHGAEGGSEHRDRVAGGHAARRLARRLRFAAVVDHDQLDPGRARAGLLHRHPDACQHVRADVAGRAGQGERDGDAQLLVPGGGRAGQNGEEQERRRDKARAVPELVAQRRSKEQAQERRLLRRRRSTGSVSARATRLPARLSATPGRGTPETVGGSPPAPLRRAAGRGCGQVRAGVAQHARWRGRMAGLALRRRVRPRVSTEWMFNNPGSGPPPPGAAARPGSARGCRRTAARRSRRAAGAARRSGAGP